MVSQGYRKIPGNACRGGLDYNPSVYPCTYGGVIFGFFSLKNIFTVCLVAAILYYGWPYIEGILLTLPIPDPKDYKEKVMGLFKRAKQQKGATTGKKPQPKAQGYQEGFNQAPESLEEEEDDEDDDIGRPINIQKNGKLNYDSDDEKHMENELINLDRDRSSTAADNIPKLSKPQ